MISGNVPLDDQISFAEGILNKKNNENILCIITDFQSDGMSVRLPISLTRERNFCKLTAKFEN